MDEPQQAPVAEPWSEQIRATWDAGYLAGLNDATKITKDALAAAMSNKRARVAAGQASTATGTGERNAADMTYMSSVDRFHANSPFPAIRALAKRCPTCGSDGIAQRDLAINGNPCSDEWHAIFEANSRWHAGPATEETT